MSSASPENDPAGHLLTPGLEHTEGFNPAAGVNGEIAFDEGAPALPPGATPAERDAHWRKYVYLGDSQLQLTLRAVLIGGLTGGLLSVVGIFITLQTGWGLSLTTIATLGSYAVMNALTRRSSGAIRPFTMLENNCMTSTATAASSSTGMTIVGCFGGMLLATTASLGEPARNPPMLAMGAVVFFTAVLGISIAVPFKRKMVNDEDFAWPSPRAGAEVLRGLYADGEAALRKARMLFITLGIGAVFGLFRSIGAIGEAFAKLSPSTSEFFGKIDKVIGVPGEIAFAPHRLMDAGVWLINKVSGGKWNLADPDRALKFAGASFEPSLLLGAAGMIVGMRTCLSMFLASVVLYFFLTPAMLSADAAHIAVAGEHFLPAFKIAGGTVSPSSWGLWGGTAMLVTASLVDLAFQWRAFTGAIAGLFKKRRTTGVDPVADLEVPMKWAAFAGVPAAIGLALSLHYGFGVNGWLGLLALALSLLVTLVCLRSAAETDINPIGAMGKVTQLIYARLPGASGSAAINLVAAGSTSAAGGSAVDMIADLKTSHLLGANSRKVWLAQLSGVFFGILCVIPAWYAIIPDAAHLEKFPALPAKLWSAVAKLLTSHDSGFYHGATRLMIVCSAFGAVYTIFSKLCPKAARKLPSALGIGIGLALPLSNTLSFLLGAIAMWLWEKGWKKGALFYGLVVASGLLSGQAIVESIITLIGESLKKLA